LASAPFFCVRRYNPSEVRRTTLAIAFLVAVGCGPSASPEPFFGEWRVAGPEAGKHAVGTEASFSGRTARHGDRRCDGPTYTRRWLSPETFTAAYGVSPASLELTGAQIEFVDITCADGDLDEAGTLIVRPNGTLMTVLDGTFYTLARK
jgi:hypothetical protein